MGNPMNDREREERAIWKLAIRLPRAEADWGLSGDHFRKRHRVGRPGAARGIRRRDLRQLLDRAHDHAERIAALSQTPAALRADHDLASLDRHTISLVCVHQLPCSIGESAARSTRR